MTTTAQHADYAWSVTDGGWFAELHDGFLLVLVSPASDVTEAINVLIPKHRQHIWVVEAEGYTDEGWEIWALFRE